MPEKQITPQNYIYITEGDAEVLRNMVRDYLQEQRDGPDDEPEPIIYQSPDVYIAYLSTRINAVSLDLSGFTVVSSQTGTIYKIVGNSGYTGLSDILSAKQFTKKVYNPTTNDIPAGFVIVERTKYGKWVVANSGYTLRQFELASDLSPQGTANAYMAYVLNGVYGINYGAMETVKDVVGNFRGRGYIDSTHRGSRGWAYYDQGLWKIVYLEELVKMFSFAINEASDLKGESTFDIDTQVILQPSDLALWKTADGEPPDTIGNPLAEYAPDDTIGIGTWNDTSEQYECLRLGRTKAGFIRFTLTADINSGSSAAATVTDYWGSEMDTEDPGSTVTVYAEDGRYDNIPSGNTGVAVLDIKDDKYRIVDIELVGDAAWIQVVDGKVQHIAEGTGLNLHCDSNGIQGLEIDDCGHIINLYYDDGLGGGPDWHGFSDGM